MTNDRISRIEQQLKQSLNPESLDILDESHLHAGHAGAKSGGGHFVVTIVAEQFHGKNLIQRHRMVYAALQDMMQKEIHALNIKAYTPDEI
ncbi:MAG: BolA family transcriptional regulator [Gammaproteobacteria bacterium]|nr:BolA family transcriptional regulator [Gammaproteobacteria bacterium]